MLKIKPFFLITLFIFIISQSVSAAQITPLNVLKEAMDGIIKILNNPKYHHHQSQDEERQKLLKSIHSVFDFEEMSLRTLQKQWNRFSSHQKQDFRNIYEQYLAELFLEKIQGDHEKFKITYVKQYITRRTRALIKAKIVREDDEIPISFRMKPIEGNWKVYDISIDRENLVANYRKKFKQFISHESPEELIKKIYMQLEKLRNER